MKNILLLNDFSAEAEHALAYGTMLATALNAKLLVWNIDNYASSMNANRQLVYLQKNGAQQFVKPTEQEVLSSMTEHPLINLLSKEDINNRTIHEVAGKNDVQLVIKGVNTIYEPLDTISAQVVTKSCYPLMLIPRNAPLNLFKQFAYIADLRYCRNNINGFLKELAHNVQANLSIAHISVASIPEPEAEYAKELYRKVVGPNPNNISLSFNQIKERNVKKAADVLVHVMQTDLLVMTYNKYHFSMLTAKDNTAELHDLNVPLLVFPS
ncbi:hypothetical protein [Mucilaginibacter terrae]|uniref:Replicative DNA helicase n=1 Tax=Mucilaginibacter terrae TaxID=1955052 RepID=A0ABU3H0I5_9SPHI|nr:hypothetical protein [Mucilaginibacter terrae]MDT3405525.1 replicative DNA helicase [Mucilaginibacter terrae]